MSTPHTKIGEKFGLNMLHLLFPCLFHAEETKKKYTLVILFLDCIPQTIQQVTDTHMQEITNTVLQYQCLAGWTSLWLVSKA